MSASWLNLTPRPDKWFSEPEKAHFSWRLVLTPALSCEREQHLNDKPPSALIERESTNCRCYWVCRCLVATEHMQHPNTLCGVRVLGLKEEPDIGKLCPQKQTSGLPVGGLIWDTTCLRVNILNFSHMIEWFNRRRSKKRCGLKKVLPMTSTPRCGDWGRTAGSVLEVIASLAESIFSVCLSAAQLAHRPASWSLT